MKQRHPSRAAYQEGWRHLPGRIRRKLDNWRRGARQLMRGWWGKAPNSVLLGTFPGRWGGNVWVVATGVAIKSSNPKTGPLVQIYILPADHFPADAVVNGRDEIVCGSCPQRPSVGGSCYVQTQWAPSRVWTAVKRGRTPEVTPEQAVQLLTGASVRFGAWGDPAAVSIDVWRPLLAVMADWVAYTHAWETDELDVEDWGWCMASVDNRAELDEAHERGWRTFRALYGGARPLEGEVMCPAQTHKITCAACRGCGGNRTPGRVDYVIAPHGIRVSRSEHRQLTLGGSV